MSDLPEETVDPEQEALADTMPAPEEEGDHDKPEDWMVPARASGASWEDIGQHVADSTDEALADGHSEGTVDKYLGYKPNQHARGWMERAWDSVFGETPPDGKIDLNTKTVRDDYAHALTEGTVKDAKDFADTYAASALDAAKKHGDIDDTHRRQAAAAAEGLAAGLPDRHDFVDAAVSVTDTPEDAERVRKELVKRWKDTGKSPYDLVKSETNLNKPPVPTDDPGFAGRSLMQFTSKAMGMLDFAINAPELTGQIADQMMGWVTGDHNPGWLARNAPHSEFFSSRMQGAANLVDKLMGGTGNVDFSPHSAPEDMLSTFMSFLIPIAGELKMGQVAFAGAGTLIDQYKNVRPASWGEITPVEQAVQLVAGGILAHKLMGKPINHFSPEEGGEGAAIRPIGPEEYTHDELSHMEAREKAADPNFLQRLMADQSGKLDLAGEGGDKAVQKPSFNLKEPELKEGEEPPKPGENKILEIHRSTGEGEPERVGSMRISFPPEADGKTAFIDSMTAGKIGEANPIGARDIRKLATQFFDMHPEVERIEGWRVSGARQRAGTEGLMSITRDQIEKPTADVAKLSEGYHHMSVLGGWLHDMGAALKDDGGALKLGNLPQLWGASKSEKWISDISRKMRDNFGVSFREQMSKAKQYRTIAQKQMDATPVHSWVSKNVKEWQDALALDDPADRLAAAKKSQIGQLWDAIHGDVPLAPNHPMTPVVQLMKDYRDRMHQDAAQWHLDGLMPMPDYIKGYAQGIWKNANAKWEDAHSTQANPFGDTRYLKDKTYQNIFQGIAAGEIPKFADPVMHFMTEVENHAKQFAKNEMLGNLGEYGKRNGVPVGMQDTSNPPQLLMPLHGTNYGNKMAYAPKGYAEMWNKLWDAGVMSDPFQKSMMTTMQKAVGTVNALKLAWPMFHFRTEVMATWGDMLHEVQISGAGIYKGIVTGDARLAATQTALALKSLATGLPVIPKILEQGYYARKGFKWYEQNDPTLAKTASTLKNSDIHEAIRDAGFGYERGLAESIGMSPSLHTSIIRNLDKTDGVVGNIKNLGRALVQEQREKFNNDLGVGTEDSVAARIGKGITYRIPVHAVDEFARVSQTATHFMFQYLIPRMQYGAIYEAAARWKMNNVGHTPMELREFVRNQIMDQENRKGELNMVNVFWPKMLKQAASVAMLSVGWKFGTYRGLAQAAGWDPDQGRWRLPLINNPTATASVLNTAASWMMMNAVAQYLHAGTLPTQTDTPWKDLLLFRTGTQGKRMGDVVPARGMNPGEPKEIYDLAKILFTAMGNPSKAGEAISEYAMSATNPLWQAFMGTVKDADGINHHIGEQPGGWPRFLKTQFLPMIADMNIQNRKDSGIPFQEQKWLGTREAASWAENPAGYGRMLEQQRQKDEKSELKRARKEVETYQNMGWLQDYIKEKEEQMAASGTPASAFNFVTAGRHGGRKKKL